MNTSLDATLAAIRACATDYVRVSAETRGGPRIYVAMERLTPEPSDPVAWCRMQRAVARAITARVPEYRNTRDGCRGKESNLYMLLDPR